MLMQSPDSAAILALPHSAHPKLAAFCKELASLRLITLADAVPLIEAAARDLGIAQLDIELLASKPVPFMASHTAGASEHQALVSHHVRSIMEARR